MAVSWVSVAWPSASRCDEEGVAMGSKLGPATEAAQEFRFIDDRQTELLRLGELAAGLLAGHDERRLLADASGHVASGGGDQRNRLRSRERREAAGQDDGHPVEGAAGRLRVGLRRVQAGRD